MTVRDYTDAIVRISRAKGVDPSFSAGIVFIESGGDPSAGISKYVRENGVWVPLTTYAQGVGIMQVIPVEASGNWPGRPSVTQLLDPLFSLDYGIQMLADNIARCGSKANAACAYFAGHCRPTGAVDGSGVSDSEYVRRALAAEQQFLDLNGAQAEDDDMKRLNGKSAFFHGKSLPAGDYVVNVDLDFPGIPPTAARIRVEPVLSAGGLVVRDANGAWAGPVLPPARSAQIDVFIGAISDPPLNGARGFRMSVVGATVMLDDLGIVGYW